MEMEEREKMEGSERERGREGRSGREEGREKKRGREGGVPEFEPDSLQGGHRLLD